MLKNKTNLCAPVCPPPGPQYETPLLKVYGAIISPGFFNSRVFRCPQNFCLPPTIVTVTTRSSYVKMSIQIQPHTRTVIALKFRTK